MELNNNSNSKIYSNALIKISKEMKHSHPVFIVGAPRSGTSILYRTLQKHSVFRPQKLNLPEPSMPRFFDRSFLLEDAKHIEPLNYMSFNENTRVKLIKNAKHIEPLAYMLFNREIYNQFLTSIKKIRLMHRAGHIIFGNRSIQWKLTNGVRLWWYFNLNHLVLRSFYHFAGKARKANRLVEKSPNNLAYSMELIFTFPNSKLLYIYRHPIDVYTSYVKRSKIQPDERWLKLSTDEFCRKYKNDTRLSIKYSRKMKDCFLLIKYEGFTHKTDIEFKKICKFLKVPFERQAITEKNPDLTKWEQNPYLYAEITPKTKKWQDYISYESAKYIETKLAEEMKVLNYKRYTNQNYLFPTLPPLTTTPGEILS